MFQGMRKLAEIPINIMKKDWSTSVMLTNLPMLADHLFKVQISQIARSQHTCPEPDWGFD
jgi:hypothetical protein